MNEPLPAKQAQKQTPSETIVGLLQEIVESWKNERYQKAAEQCVALLKRKKTIENLGLTVPLQRILLQAYMQLDRYETVLEWDKTTTSTSTSTPTISSKGCEDLILYARYRTKDYASVSKLAAAAAAARNSDAVEFQHLRAQSEFHLNRTEEGLAEYLGLLSSNRDVDVDVDVDFESKMEIVTNALALIASSGCTPTVALYSNPAKSNGNGGDDESKKFWLQEAEALLYNHDHDATDGPAIVDDEMFADLASNLGCIRFLTDPTTEENNWFEHAATTTTTTAAAAAAAGETGSAAGLSEQTNTNLQWSKHFWYKDIEDVRYDNVLATPSSSSSSSSSKSKNNNNNKLSVVQSIARVNQSLLDENLSRLPPQPHPKWNLLQVRMYWYDRAILQLKAGKHVECHDSCQSLKKTLSSNTTNSAAAGSQEKKKKDKGNASSSASSSTSTSSSTKKRSSVGALWWEARADVVLAYAQQAQSKHKDALGRLAKSLKNLQLAAEAFSSSSSSSSSSTVVVDHAMAHVLLHQFVMEQKGGSNKKDRKKQKRELLNLFKSLPESIQSRPALQLTMDDLQTAVNNDDASSNNKTKSTPKSPLEEADVLFLQGQYQEACKLYQGALTNDTDDGNGNGNGNDDDTIMDSQLRYVQALAMSGQHEASQELWQSLESYTENNTPTTKAASLPDGGALENKTLPRGTTTGSSSRSSINKKLAAANTAAKDDDDEADKPSREKILRRRARKREAYLKELESKGKYNPDRPTKPDPERWTPKHERSRSGKNRGGRNHNNKGLNSAQGGGSRLDAQRLDAAARRAGKVPASSVPSSANLKVSSGGRKGGRRR